MALEGGLLKSGGSAVWRAQAVAHLCMDAGVYAARQAPWARASCAVAQEAAIGARFAGCCARTARGRKGHRGLRRYRHRAHHTYERRPRDASGARARTRTGGGVKARAFAARRSRPGAALQGAMY